MEGGNTMSKKVVLGLSGGVDSAVAARLLSERGFEVFGLYMDIAGEAAKRDAIETARFLNVRLEVVDISRELEENVCSYFVDSYLRGETPNPCIMCNPMVKFKTLISCADKIGADYIATGHYARAIDGGLYKGQPSNDQSYMLCQLRLEQLSRTVFPLGELEKKQVRALAAEMNLPVANKPDSMEICFVPDGDFGSFIESRGTFPSEGNFVSPEGEVLGRHRGIHRYTVGQGKRLGIALGKRTFVSEIRSATNEIVLSDGDELFVREINVKNVNWLVPKHSEFCATVRVRHSKQETGAKITPTETGADICFNEPVRAPVRGQTAAFYDSERVIGGGFIQ